MRRAARLEMAKCSSIRSPECRLKQLPPAKSGRQRVGDIRCCGGCVSLKRPLRSQPTGVVASQRTTTHGATTTAHADRTTCCRGFGGTERAAEEFEEKADGGMVGMQTERQPREWGKDKGKEYTPDIILLFIMVFSIVSNLSVLQSASSNP